MRGASTPPPWVTGGEPRPGLLAPHGRIQAAAPEGFSVAESRRALTIPGSLVRRAALTRFHRRNVSTSNYGFDCGTATGPCQVRGGGSGRSSTRHEARQGTAKPFSAFSSPIRSRPARPAPFWPCRHDCAPTPSRCRGHHRRPGRVAVHCAGLDRSSRCPH